MRILRHSKIGITIEVYTEVPSPAPVMHFASAATGLPDEPVAVFLCCCTPIKRAGSAISEPACELVGDTGIEPVTSSV